MTVPPLVEFKDASLGYGREAVLIGVNLQIHPGEFWGILGHNGSGKSTLVKTILGLISPIGGQMLFRGARDANPRFGYVPQKEKLDPIYPLSAYEVAEMGTYRKLELFRILRGKAHRELVLRCLEDCGASDLAGKRYSDLSGGQKQRVLIARALAAEPEMLILDEPLAGIDITTQKALLKLFEEFSRERHLTMIMVSHRLHAEKTLFSHAAWVDQSEVASGTTAEMLAHGPLSKVFDSDL